MKLKDYINYYIGCPCIFYMADDDPEGYPMTLDYDTIKKWLADQDETDIKLVLRRLEDITEEEIREYSKLVELRTDGVHNVYISCDTPESFHYLLTHHFDLFGLIDAGLAVDVNTFNP